MSAAEQPRVSLPDAIDIATEKQDQLSQQITDLFKNSPDFADKINKNSAIAALTRALGQTDANVMTLSKEGWKKFGYKKKGFAFDKHELGDLNALLTQLRTQNNEAQAVENTHAISRVEIADKASEDRNKITAEFVLKHINDEFDGSSLGDLWGRGKRNKRQQMFATFFGSGEVTADIKELYKLRRDPEAFLAQGTQLFPNTFTDNLQYLHIFLMENTSGKDAARILTQTQKLQKIACRTSSSSEAEPVSQDDVTR